MYNYTRTQVIIFKKITWFEFIRVVVQSPDTKTFHNNWISLTVQENTKIARAIDIDNRRIVTVRYDRYIYLGLCTLSKIIPTMMVP